MKTKLVLSVILTSLLFLYGCSDNEDNVQESESVSKSSSSSKGSSAVSQNYPQAQQEVIETFGAIAQSIKDGDIDKLISFHAYGPKFTEFNHGPDKGFAKNGGDKNEAIERATFGAVTEVVKFAAENLSVAVYYGNVANLTFHSDFHLKFGTELVIVHDQITLLFVKTKGEWKMVHEHHSPLNDGIVLDLEQ